MLQWDNKSVLLSCIESEKLEYESLLYDFLIHLYLMLTYSRIKVSQLHTRLQFNWGY